VTSLHKREWEKENLPNSIKILNGIYFSCHGSNIPQDPPRYLDSSNTSLVLQSGVKTEERDDKVIHVNRIT
jgi:hypothetical protein